MSGYLSVHSTCSYLYVRPGNYTCISVPSDLDSHVHLYFGVWLVVVNDKIFKLEVIDVSHLSPDLQLGEGTGGTLQLSGRVTHYTLHHPFSPYYRQRCVAQVTGG